MTKILGLTGGIASGKTSVANYLKGLNIDVIDADNIARELMQAGEPLVFEIAEQFGEEVLLSNGEINRKKLGSIIFESDEEREKLNHLVQGKIREKIKENRKKLMRKDKKLIVLDIPLLYEENYESFVDEVMVVYLDEDLQLKRLMNRNKDLTKEDARNRIKAQMPLEKKIKKADVLINNNGNFEQTIKQVDDWLKENFRNFFKTEKE